MFLRNYKFSKTFKPKIHLKKIIMISELNTQSINIVVFATIFLGYILLIPFSTKSIQ